MMALLLQFKLLSYYSCCCSTDPSWSCESRGTRVLYLPLSLISRPLMLIFLLQVGQSEEIKCYSLPSITASHPFLPLMPVKGQQYSAAPICKFPATFCSSERSSSYSADEVHLPHRTCFAKHYLSCDSRANMLSRSLFQSGWHKEEISHSWPNVPPVN